MAPTPSGKVWNLISVFFRSDYIWKEKIKEWKNICFFTQFPLPCCLFCPILYSSDLHVLSSLLSCVLSFLCVYHPIFLLSLFPSSFNLSLIFHSYFISFFSSMNFATNIKVKFHNLCFRINIKDSEL